MARKSLADRIRESSNKTTQKELDRSKELIDRIIQDPPGGNDAPPAEASGHSSAAASRRTTGKNSGTSQQDAPSNNSDQAIDNVVHNITDSPTGHNEATLTRSVIKPVPKTPKGSVINYHSPRQYSQGSVAGSVTPSNEPFDPVFPENEVTLSKRQKEVFLYLVSIGDHAFIQATHASQVTGIPLPTIRKILRDFREKNFLKYKRYQQGGKKGIVYELNLELKEELLAAAEKEPVTVSVIKPSVTGSVTPHNSSSSFSFHTEKTTTTSEIQQIQKMLQTHPEMGYWRQKGLTEKQVAEWMRVADCGLDRMASYLSYCRFEMVELDLEQSKPIHDVFNWFFKILERSGQYRKPRGYLSHTERKLEAERTAVEEKRKQIEALKALKREQWEQERELEFWEMLNDTEGELYRRCFSKLNNFDRKRARKGGKAFEMAMRRAYDQIVNEIQEGDEEGGEGG
jgi:hypothetical protein